MILVIDDNRDLLSIMCRMLEISGYECIGVSNGEEGIKIAKEQEPGLIICDIGMEVMTGYDVARNIRNDKKLKDIYMIAISGYSSGRDIKASKESGFNMHLVKPVKFDKLLEIIKNIY